MHHLYSSTFFRATIAAFFLMSWSLVSFAQSGKVAELGTCSGVRPQGSVIYRQQLGPTAVSKATLVFANQQSLYYYARKEVDKASLAYKEIDELQYVVDVEDREGQCVYKDTEQKLLLTREYDLTGNILLEEPIPVFDWVVGDATKTIGNYRVQQASTTFRGRQYEVWFAPDIPLPLGPWKLGGLPGLILEAYDTDKRFVFEAVAIALPTLIETLVAPPTDGERVLGWEAYRTRTKAAAARMIKSMQAASPGVVVKMNRPGQLEVVD